MMVSARTMSLEPNSPGLEVQISLLEAAYVSGALCVRIAIFRGLLLYLRSL